jgi:hypothetical protein
VIQTYHCILRKKKKAKDSTEKQEAQSSQVNDVCSSSSGTTGPSDSAITLTKAEKSFLKMQEKRVKY